MCVLSYIARGAASMYAYALGATTVDLDKLRQYELVRDFAAPPTAASLCLVRLMDDQRKFVIYLKSTDEARARAVQEHEKNEILRQLDKEFPAALVLLESQTD